MVRRTRLNPATTLADVSRRRIYDIREFIRPGESLIADGSGAGNNTTIIQRAVDFLTALWVGDGIPRQVGFADGIYMMTKTGDEGGVNPYCVRWKSGVGIATSSKRGVIFKAPADATPFMAAYSFGNIQRVYCDPHVVDGAAQTNGTYTTKLKGWFIQGLGYSRFEDVSVLNCFATGFGCDFLYGGTVVTGEANYNGRGLGELGITPTTTSGGSGFGIGTGRYALEDFTLDVTARGNGFHGVFTETQASAGEPYTATKGGRIRATVINNFVGFRDCGCDGLQADITAIGNTYAGVLHDRTILAPSAGINGNLRLDADGNQVGLRIEKADAGGYRFTGEIRNSTSHGVWVTSSASVAAHTELSDLRLHHNGGRGALVSSATSSLALHRIAGWSNNGADIALMGSSLATTGLEMTDCDVRGGGATIEQQLTTQLVDRNRGTVNYVVLSPKLKDSFNTADVTSITGRNAPDGSITNVPWETYSTSGTATYGVASKFGLPTAGTVPALAVLNSGTANAKIRATAATIKGTTPRRCSIIARLTDANNYYRVVCDTGVWVLSKLVAGAATTLITTTVTAASGDVIELDCATTTLTLTINGVSQGSVTDSSLTGTRFGVSGTYSNDIYSRHADVMVFY